MSKKNSYGLLIANGPSYVCLLKKRKRTNSKQEGEKSIYHRILFVTSIRYIKITFCIPVCYYHIKKK